MSVIIGKGMILSVCETELECPICSFNFDASEKMDKAKTPTFKTKCPACKSTIGISVPILGGTTKCFEWDTPPNVEKLETITKFTVTRL